MKQLITFIALLCSFFYSNANEKVQSWGTIQFGFIETNFIDSTLTNYYKGLIPLDVHFNILEKNAYYSRRDENVLRKEPSFCFDFTKPQNEEELRVWNLVDKVNDGFEEERLRSFLDGLDELDGKNFLNGIWTADSLFLYDHPFDNKEIAYPFRYRTNENQLTIEIKRSATDYNVKDKEGKKMKIKASSSNRTSLYGVWILGEYRIVFTSPKEARKMVDFSSFYLIDPFMKSDQFSFMFIYYEDRPIWISNYWFEDETLCLYSAAKEGGFFMRIPFQLSEDGKIFKIRLYRCPTTLSYQFLEL